jgi:hypothetical protein
VLINEVHTLVLSEYLGLIKDRSKPDKVSSAFREFYYRSFSREFEFLLERAKDVLKLSKDMEEAKKFIKE